MIEISLKDGRTFMSSIEIAEAVRNWNDAQGFGIPFKVSDSLWVSGDQVIRIEQKQKEIVNYLSGCGFKEYNDADWIRC